MLLTRNWLNKYLNLSPKITNQEIGVALNSLGFEVEEEINYETLNKKLVIGYIKEHSLVEGTHLSLNQVQISKTKTIQILTSATNAREGQFVIVAPIGAEIANGITMAKRKMAGYESNGMMCSLNEIGFNNNVLSADEQEEIYVIKNYPVKKLETLIGHSVNVLGFNDYSWEIDLTLNRSDGLSAFQLAKELANYFKVGFKKSLVLKKVGSISLSSNFTIKVDRRISDVVNSVAFSSFSLTNNDFKLMVTDDLWLKMSGSKTTGLPIYDLANKVGIETGQPVILLDGDKISSLSLELKTIDDHEVVVLKQKNELVNVIGQLPVDQYQVSSSTKNILAIYLNFDQTIMRKQQQALNLSNVALQRYMKPMFANKASLANQSLKRIFSNYDILKAISGEKYLVGPVKTHNQIKTSLSYINEFLGTSLTMKQVTDLFKNLDFKLTNKKGDELIFVVDQNRIDLTSPIDLTEEVARLYGYDNIPTIPLTMVGNYQDGDLNQELKTKVSNYLIGLGMNNIKTYSLVSSQENQEWNLFNLKHPVKLLAPLSANHEQYRLSLASSMVETISYNLARGNKQLRFFEIGEVYHDKFKHETHLMIGINGKFDYYDLKSYVDAIFNFYNLNFIDVEFETDADVNEQIHPYINAEIVYHKYHLGFIYKLNPAFENANKLGPTFLAELDLNSLMKAANFKITSQEFSKFQASSRDLSFELTSNTPYQEVIKGLINNVKNLVGYEIIDIYQDNKIFEKKSQLAIAISFTFNSLEEQMSEVEINSSWDQILKNAKTLGLKVR